MSFISYAQNFEDVMLWRALRGIKNGFYIDVGAWSPKIDSVTRAFYERGWRGINIEPNPEYHAQLLTERNRDVNLCIGISDRDGSRIMNFLSNPGLSTFDEAITQKHSIAGLKIDKQEVEDITLKTLWEKHVPEGQEVHFLKVDVEGHEEAVLRGNDWSKYRPWIVVVEATLPMSQEECYKEWEPIILDASYLFAYADGLNRFYVADEHNDLLSAFKYPSNVFDDFKLGAQHEAETRACEAEAKSQEAETRACEAEAKFQDCLISMAIDKERSIWLEDEWNVTKLRIEDLTGDVALFRDWINKLEAQLAEKFRTLDDSTQALAQERERSQWLENEWNVAKAKIEELNANSHHWWTAADSLNRELRAMQSSRCWRFTRPARNIFDIFLLTGKKLSSIPRIIKGGLLALLSPILTPLMRFAMDHPRLKAGVLACVHRFPRCDAWVHRFALEKGIISPGPTVYINPVVPDEPLGNISDLTPDARRIYADLKAAIERNNKGGY
jgi:FkbM family methyltransferase